VILHLNNIQNVHLNGEYKLENLFDVFNLGAILDFEIKNKTIELGVLWKTIRLSLIQMNLQRL
jgi:hypothetical protein